MYIFFAMPKQMVLALWGCSERVSHMSKSAIETYKKLKTFPADSEPSHQEGSSLLPMLVSGLILIVIGMLVVAAIS